MLERLHGFLRRPALYRCVALARRFAGDCAGSILPIAAIGSLVLVGLVGGGVDMARAYKAERRLQAACDAGALAGRRSVEDEGFDATALAQANKFFAANYNYQEQGTTNPNPAFVAQDGGNTIAGSASAQVNTVLMRVFGFNTIPLSVTCKATMGVGNSDVTFVLDVTKSMQWPDSCASSECSSGFSEGSGSRIYALKKALRDFYNTVYTATTGSNARVRYSFVPYATTVNVGRLLSDLDSDYLADEMTIRSRQPVQGNCSSGTVVTEDDTLFNQWCYRNVTFDTSVYKTFTAVTNPKTTDGEVAYINGREITSDDCGGRWEPACPYETRALSTSDTWNGCIIERKTTPAPTFSFVSLATGIVASNAEPALDLDIDSAPTADQDTKWRPMWPKIAIPDNGGAADSHCPYKSQTLQKMTKAEFQSYIGFTDANVNTTSKLKADSMGTYHDTGLLWGARLSSDKGIFAANVNDTTGLVGGTVSRHLIFMTDGTLQPFLANNAMYGVETADSRITDDAGASFASTNGVCDSGNTSQLCTRYKSRILAICEAVKARGVRLWVISFGPPLSTDLTTCASPGSAFRATSSSQLNKYFQEIAKQVGELRVSQ